jgi:excisionase family DNA binding protein
MEKKSILTLDELLTIQELTERLKVKTGWVYQRIHAGTLPFDYCKVGAFLRFPASSVQKYITSQTRKGAA